MKYSRILLLVFLFVIATNLATLAFLWENASIRVEVPPGATRENVACYPCASLSNAMRVEMVIPAVGPDGTGVTSLLRVEAMPGPGRSLVNVDNLLFWTDTQHSIRVARRVAERVLNKSLDGIDLVYEVNANATMVEGPSAGAAVTIATIAAIENKSLRKNVTITGTINSDGTIGPVGGILEKARAAKAAGLDAILVPLGQGEQVVYKPVERCDKYGRLVYCQTEYVPERINISGEAGIRVIEVGSIPEALGYFLG